MNEYKIKFRMDVGLWWWFVIWSLFNTIIVIATFARDKVSWVTWLNGSLAIILALYAGPYPVKSDSKENSTPTEKEE